MLPRVVVKKPGKKLPEEDYYFVVARNGVFMHKDAGIVRATLRVPVDRLSFLENHEEEAELLVNPVPFSLFAQVYNFFAAVFAKHHTEATVVLFYNEETGVWSVAVPQQTTTYNNVRYDRTISLEEEGFVQAGTIHSHCDFGAFHSGGDMHDEESFDGLHVTIGNVNSSHPTVSATVVVNAHRFHQDLDRYLEGVEEKEFEYKVPVPERFVPPTPRSFERRQRVTVIGNGNARKVTWSDPIATFFSAFTAPFTSTQVSVPEPIPEPKPEPRFTIQKGRHIVLQAPDGSEPKDFPFPPEWMSKVSPMVSPVMTPYVHRTGGTTVRFQEGRSGHLVRPAVQPLPPVSLLPTPEKKLSSDQVVPEANPEPPLIEPEPLANFSDSGSVVRIGVVGDPEEEENFLEDYFRDFEGER